MPSADRDSGSNAGARARSASITGTLTRNTEPHQACSSSTPPTTGPSAAPAANPVAQIASARRRWSRSANSVRSSARVEGISIAPKTPSRARAATRCAASVANAAAADTAPNPVTPISSSRRRPNRSPSVPIVTSSPASASG